MMEAAADAEAEMKAATESDAEAAAAVAFLSSIHFNNTLSKYYRDWGSASIYIVARDLFGPPSIRAMVSAQGTANQYQQGIGV